MKDWQTILLLPLAGLLVGLALGFRTHAQEKPARPTRQWLASEITYRDGSFSRVDVIDTEGVCLYVAVRGSFVVPNNIAITAVPKTQLPAGVGCQ